MFNRSERQRNAPTYSVIIRLDYVRICERKYRLGTKKKQFSDTSKKQMPNRKSKDKHELINDELFDFFFLLHHYHNKQVLEINWLIFNLLSPFKSTRIIISRCSCRKYKNDFFAKTAFSLSFLFYLLPLTYWGNGI